MAKPQVCGLHCPNGMVWFFAVVAAWFVLGDMGWLLLYGGFWSWMVLLAGICTYVCTKDPKHQRSGCPFAALTPTFGMLFALLGAWFVLGDAHVLPTFGISLLHAATALAAFGIMSGK